MHDKAQKSRRRADRVGLNHKLRAVLAQTLLLPFEVRRFCLFFCSFFCQNQQNCQFDGFDNFSDIYIASRKIATIFCTVTLKMAVKCKGNNSVR